MAGRENHRQISHAALLVLMALSLTACGQPTPSAPPVELQPSQAEAMLRQSSALDGKRVVVEGYVHFDNGQQGEAIAMRPELRSSPSGGGEELAPFETPYGPGPNQLDLNEISKGKPPGFDAAPEIITFDPAKATWQDSGGVSHPLSQKVRLTGTASYPSVAGHPYSQSPTGKRFLVILKKVVLEPAP
ncbi:MAG: hypothetical protein Q7T61_20900 [Caulobacter sp.]|nr:hypothetical protein [Caulobacter sp.]